MKYARQQVDHHPQEALVGFLLGMDRITHGYQRNQTGGDADQPDYPRIRRVGSAISFGLSCGSEVMRKRHKKSSRGSQGFAKVWDATERCS